MNWQDLTKIMHTTFDNFAPDEATWVVIHPSLTFLQFFDGEPRLGGPEGIRSCMWVVDPGVNRSRVLKILFELPKRLNWRWCKWRRPE